MRTALRNPWFIVVLSLCGMVIGGCSDADAPDAPEEQDVTQPPVDEVVPALMTAHDIPGMAVAISHKGEDYFFNFGVIDRETGAPVTRETIFEIGSVSKLFTVSLAAHAEHQGLMSLDAAIGEYVNELTDAPLGEVPVFHLATHTAGGFPLQLPDEVDSETALFEYFRAWKPEYPTGTARSYANPSIGLLGVLAARVKGEDFAVLMERDLFPSAGMSSTYINVPDAALANYSWGHNRDGEQVRVNPAVLANEAYGVKTTSADLLEFLKLNLDSAQRSEPWTHAIRRMHTGHFDTGFFQQALLWEKYAFPIDTCKLKDGNSTEMVLESAPVVAVDATAPSDEAYALSKTGSTGGFGAYVLLVPHEDFALLMLANKYYPNGARLETGHRIMAEMLSLDTKYCD